MVHVSIPPVQQVNQTADDDHVMRSSVTRSLDRGLSILQLVLDSPEPQTLTSLAGQAGLSKATALRLLNTLTRNQLIQQDRRTKAYVPGLRLAIWSLSLRSTPALTEAFHSTLAAICAETGETASIHVIRWPDRTCVAVENPDRHIYAHKEVGSSAAVTRGCTGRAFLLSTDRDRIDRALQARPLVPLTSKSVATTEDFYRKLGEERAQGYTVSLGGTDLEMNGVSVPLHGQRGTGATTEPALVVNVSGPSHRWTLERIKSYVPSLMKAANDAFRLQP